MSPAAVPTESGQQRLTLANVAALRNRTPLPTALVAASHSDMFKSSVWLIPITPLGDGQQPKLKTIAPLLKNPGLWCARCIGELSVSISAPAAPDFKDLKHHTATKHDIRDETSRLDLNVVLNYGHAFGTPPLVRFVTEHTEIIHDPPYSNWSCTLTVGSTSSWDTTMRLFCERGDYILFEEFTFSSAREAAIPMGLHQLAVKMDEQGPLPEVLDEILTNWDAKAKGARKPRLFYTIPTGHNPTGITHSLERRKAIYEVSRKHDLVLVEDEPYYFLQMQKYKGAGQSENKTCRSHEEFIASLVPSYLSMDVDGRVIRFDSFSKIIAPGTRIGWITASNSITETFCRQAESSIQSPSGISQIALHKLLEDWDHAGFLEWLMHIQSSYTERRDALNYACERYLPTEISSWVVTEAGMFVSTFFTNCAVSKKHLNRSMYPYSTTFPTNEHLQQWIKVDWRKHPEYKNGKTHAEIEKLVFDAIVKEGSLVALGSWFQTDTNQKDPDMYFRVTFASAPLEKIEEAIRRLGTALRKVFNLER
ncbi:Aromatic/aminoadipate aminotransferase 1 [Ascosphaera aggregata]|nr:Aromatic/aminoadipate aminotransferase 1 [Ascosphaera aggregata]